MKIVLALGIFLLLTINISAQWNWRNPSIPGSEYSQIQFIKDVGYIACFGGVIKTTDGGQTWQYKYIKNSVQNTCLSFIDEMYGVVGGKHIYKTTDGGETWEIGRNGVDTENNIGWINTIEMIDNKKGFANYLSQNASSCFLITYDGGKNWVWNGNNFFGQIFDICFFDSTNGIISDYFEGLWKTKDGGNSWIKLNNENYNIKSLSFIDSINGFGVMQNHFPTYYYILKTSDGGKNWIFQTLNKSYKLNKIFFIDSLNATAVGDPGIILRTSDAGANWLEQSSGTNQNLTDVYFNDELNGIIVCARNNESREDIIKTTDGGRTWFSINHFITKYNLKDASFADYKTGVVVGDKGVILRTSDSGITWNIQESGTNENLFHVDLTNGKGVAVAENGLILKTTDKGLSWWSYASGTSLKKVQFINDSIGIALSGNAILKTNNGGMNWFVQIIPPYNLVNLSFPTEKSGIVIGTSFNPYNADPILITTNGGITWNTKYYGNENTELKNVYFVDTLIGYITSFVNIYNPQEPPTIGNTLLKTNNGWLSWEQGRGIKGSNLKDIYFSDALNGFAIGNELFETNDGCNNWNEVGVSGKGLKKIFSLDNNNAIVVGDYGTIITFNRDILPIELSLFTAAASNEKIILNWKTTTELNNTGFEIQKKNENNNYNIIGFVKGSGTSLTPCNYQYIDKEKNNGKYTYRLKQIDYDGSFKFSNEVEVVFNSSLGFSLAQCYPNPFNSTTKIKFSILNEAETSLKIYDVLGREVKTIFDEMKKQGNYTIEINGNNLSSGIYFYKLNSGEYSDTKKMILLK